MIRPPGFAGVIFGSAAWGDLRHDQAGRADAAGELGLPPDWAFLNQVHGATVLKVVDGGNQGDGDAMVTARPLLALLVATADCVPVAIEADGAVAVVHAGWRGAVAGVLPAALDTLQRDGHTPRRAAIGPAIGPCCYEVGEDVAARFAEHVARTTWGTTSVDIPGYLATQLQGIPLWRSEECTYTSSRLNSWRRDRTKERQVTVAWLPQN